ncbi:hypothetical protein RhiirA1_474784 [Rhizophagus irregularis]|uniref:BAH domain-containing protein n=1 Tax=Rhizophagus irregularis TaxID=588596 RepID=A0A2N0QXZ6_9GLOM|nr:hypothetical protein RhiirA1_474784 [Rhizophagus irregularis]
MSYIRRRTSNNTIFKNIGIRRRTNISHSCQNFVPASSRFNNNNSASNTSKTNRTRKPFTDRLNLEIQEERHVQNEENMTQYNDYDFFESEIQDIEEESIIQIEDNTIIQDVVGEENRVRDNNSNEDIGCIIETRNSHVKYDSVTAYKELVKILKHPEFKCNKVPNNLASLKRYRNGLPLLPVKNHIKTILNNPSLKNNIYFGPGIEVSTNRTEFWHGTLWQESPLFGCEKMTINNIIFFTGEFIQYRIESNTKIGRILAFVTDKNNNTKIKVQQFLYNYELPCNFHSAARDSTKLRMTDRVIMISESRIITRISVWLKDNQESSSYDYKVDEILYKFNNRYMMRPIKFRHYHLSEYIKLHPSPLGIQTLKIFIDLYFDDFGTFRTSYHSLGGNFEDVIRPFINDLLILQKDLFMKIGNEEYWISGGLGVVTADLPQGNDLAGILRHNANLGCRSYLTMWKSKDRHIQTPQDPFHMMAGLGGRLLDSTFEIFIKEGLENFIITWKNFEMPTTWFLDNTIVKSEVIQEIKTKLVFTSTLKSTDYIRIDQLTKTFSDVVLKLFPNDFRNLLNLHALKHLSEHAKRYGSFVNISVSLKEMVHRLFKNQVPHTNKKNLELDFIKRENTLQGIRFILDNGFDECYQNTQFSSILHNHKLKFLCDTWYILSASMNDDISEDQVTIHSPLKNYINITVSGKWSLQEIRKAGFNGKDLDDNMKNDNSSLRSTVKLHVGELVDVPEVSGDNDDDNEEWFAKIIAIIIYKDNNNNNCIFLMFDWFEYLNFDTNI